MYISNYDDSGLDLISLLLIISVICIAMIVVNYVIGAIICYKVSEINGFSDEA